MGKSTKEKEFDIEKKVVVKNIASWGAAFNKIETHGSIDIAAEGKTKLPRSEILAQIQEGNRLFTGVDGYGSHATLYIDDKDTRVEAGFEDPDEGRVQLVLTDELATKLFDISDQKSFEDAFVNAIKTRAEKYAIMQMIKRLGFDCYSKINFAQKYTGYRLQ